MVQLWESEKYESVGQQACKSMLSVNKWVSTWELAASEWADGAQSVNSEQHKKSHWIATVFMPAAGPEGMKQRWFYRSKHQAGRRMLEAEVGNFTF